MSETTCYCNYICAISGENIREYVLAPLSFLRLAIANGYSGPDAIVAAELDYRASQRKKKQAEIKQRNEDAKLMMVCI